MRIYTTDFSLFLKSNPGCISLSVPNSKLVENTFHILILKISFILLSGTPDNAVCWSELSHKHAIVNNCNRINRVLLLSAGFFFSFHAFSLIG